MRIVDAYNLLGARLNAILVKLLSFNTLTLSVVDGFRGCQTLLFQLYVRSLELLDFLNLKLYLALLFWSKFLHVNIRIYVHYALLVLKPALLDNLSARLLKNVINFVLDSLINLTLAR